MKCLIAGCGYMGYRLALRWQQAGHEVFATTRSESRAAQFRKDNMTPILADLATTDSWISLPEIDIVVWAVGFDRAAAVSREQVWLHGLRKLISSFPSSPERFLYTSSTSVYGDAGGNTIDESTPVSPATEGGKCCVEAEQIIRDACADWQSTSPILMRMAGIYGPDRLLRRISDLQSGSPLGGIPDNWLNLIHVDDAVEMINCLATVEQPPNVVNVVNSHSVSRRQYYECLARLSNSPAPVFSGETSTNRGQSGNRRVVSRVRPSLPADFRFDDISVGLADAVLRSRL